MKKMTILLCMFLCVFALHARAIQEEFAIAEEKSRLSYALGMLIGVNFDLSEYGLEFDYGALAEGVKAIMEKDASPLLSYNEAMEIVETALYTAMDRIATENKLREEQFLYNNSMRQGVRTLQSGVQYEVIREGDGDTPHEFSLVRVHYSGTLIDGTIFDESYEEEGAYIPLDMVIPGWAEGVLQMKVGGIHRIYIPSELAYGPDGIQGYVPPYSTLVFMVELLEIMEDSNYLNSYQDYDYDWEP
ncbi:MAG: FKBP-type peptidyl-prolyl cis-trans isomerase [Treponema sp.]|nr:FKBP-type peptidyl-prolyl cis-trans isomerase [Treponema sp.]